MPSRIWVPNAEWIAIEAARPTALWPCHGAPAAVADLAPRLIEVLTARLPG